MNTPKDEVKNAIIEVSPRELTTLELDGVNGGMKNKDTALFAAFQDGIDMGMIMAGARPTCGFIVF
jgi:hypothetical protein